MNDFFEDRSSRRRFVVDLGFAGGALLAAVAWGWTSAAHEAGDPPPKHEWRKGGVVPGEHDHPMPAGDVMAAPPHPPTPSPTPTKRVWRRNPVQPMPPREHDHLPVAGKIAPRPVPSPPRPAEHDHPPPPGSMPAPRPPAK